MSVSGISPQANDSSGHEIVAAGLQSDDDSDRELTLGVIRHLPNVSVLDRSAMESCLTYPVEIEIDISWQLDSDSPLSDFVSQLLDLLRRTTISQGVALDKELLGRLGRITHHALCVSGALETVRNSNKTSGVSSAGESQAP